MSDKIEETSTAAASELRLIISCFTLDVRTRVLVEGFVMSLQFSMHLQHVEHVYTVILR